MKKALLCIVGLLFFTSQTGTWAVNIDNGTIQARPGDIVIDQTDGTRAGYDFRFSYQPNINNYDGTYGIYHINDISQPNYHGYMSTVHSQTGTETYIAADFPIIPAAVKTESWLIWHFDFSEAGKDFNAIDQLQIKLQTNTYDIGSSITVQVSRDGISWNEIFAVADGASYKAYRDVTEYVNGSSEYFVKATLYATNNAPDAKLFRTSIGFGFDNQVWLIPEPATMVLLAAGGLTGVLIRKKRLDR